MLLLKIGATILGLATLAQQGKDFLEKNELQAICTEQTSRWIRISYDLRTLRDPGSSRYVALAAARVKESCGEMPAGLERAPYQVVALVRDWEIEYLAQQDIKKALRKI